MALKVDILIEDLRWSELSNLSDTIEKVCKYTYEMFDSEISEEEVSIVLSNDDTIRDLNNRYRGLDKPTNVLSFANEDSFVDEMELNSIFSEDIDFNMLGDIVIAYETVVKEANEQKKTLFDHFVHMLVHGMLHLLGMDHIDEQDAVEMEDLERLILSNFNISDPYLEFRIVN